MLEFLEPLFVTGAGSNDVDYSNREFDGAVTGGAGRGDILLESQALDQHCAADPAQDMPVVPLWDYIGAAGRSAAVDNVVMTWNDCRTTRTSSSPDVRFL
jgi:oligopeptide transport system substrate-binding protein